MGKRIAALDPLGEIRRVLRILRRMEKWLAQCERDERRRAGRRQVQPARGPRGWCKATTASGEPCRMAIRSGDYCAAHLRQRSHQLAGQA